MDRKLFLAAMKKEVFLAIAIGFALGLVITFGIWTANKSLATMNKGVAPTPTVTVADPKVTPKATPAATAQTGLAIDVPADEAFTNSNTTAITGRASANATIVIAYEGDEQIVLADGSGNFTANIALIAGYNQITVTAFDAAGKSVSQTLIVTYSTATI